MDVRKNQKGSIFIVCNVGTMGIGEWDWGTTNDPRRDDEMSLPKGITDMSCVRSIDRDRYNKAGD